MKKIHLTDLDKIEPTPTVERFTKKSKRNPKRDAKREKRSKRKVINTDLYSEIEGD
jgi:hypothetical protein